MTAEKPAKHFSEQQINAHNEAIKIAKDTLEEIKSEKLLTDQEVVADLKDGTSMSNFLILHRYARQAYRITYSIRNPEKGSMDPNERISIFDEVLRKLSDAGIKVYNQIPNELVLKQKRGYSSWEFLGVRDEYEMSETISQDTLIEICEMIANKIGVDLNI